MKKLFNSKKKKIIIGVIIMFSVVIVSTFTIVALQPPKKLLEVKKDIPVVEYGNKISTNSSDYLDVGKLSKEETTKVLKDTKVDLKSENEVGKDYPKLGKYDVTLIYKKEKKTVKVEVKDTIAPVFNEVNNVEFIQETDFNYAEVITATDLQEVTYNFDIVTVDKNTIGEYDLKVIATDKSNNLTEKIIKVKVLEKPKEVVEEVPTTVETPKTTKDNATTNDNNTTTNDDNSNNTATDDEPKVQEPTICKSQVGNSGQTFNTTAEADAWVYPYYAQGVLFDGKEVSSYSTPSNGCGGYTVYFVFY